MMRFFLCLLIGFGLSACSVHDERYYASNPKALEVALAKCPAEPPSNITCEQLQAVANKVNQLAYLLRSDQQAYGLSIIHLQQSIAEHDSLTKREALTDRLSVVKWLLSPGG